MNEENQHLPASAKSSRRKGLSSTSKKVLRLNKKRVREQLRRDKQKDSFHKLYLTLFKVDPKFRSKLQDRRQRQHFVKTGEDLPPSHFSVEGLVVDDPDTNYEGVFEEDWISFFSRNEIIVQASTALERMFKASVGDGTKEVETKKSTPEETAAKHREPQYSMEADGTGSKVGQIDERDLKRPCSEISLDCVDDSGFQKESWQPLRKIEGQKQCISRHEVQQRLRRETIVSLSSPLKRSPQHAQRSAISLPGQVTSDGLHPLLDNKILLRLRKQQLQEQATTLLAWQSTGLSSSPRFNKRDVLVNAAPPELIERPSQSVGLNELETLRVLASQARLDVVGLTQHHHPLQAALARHRSKRARLGL